MHDEPYEEYKGYSIYLEQDHDPQDPREWDNVGVMVCYHRNYSLGDFHEKRKDGRVVQSWTAEDAQIKLVELARDAGATIEASEYGTYEDSAIEKAINHLDKVGVILPLYLLDHSGIAMRVGRFASDPQGWDTSMVGYIVATPARIKEIYQPKRIHNALLCRVEKGLQNEVETYSKYISGDVVGYVVKKDGEDIESCWGYYDNDDALHEARAQVDYHIASTLQKHLAKKKIEIIKHVPLEKRTVLV